MDDNNFFARLEKKINPYFSHAKGMVYYFDFNHSDIYMVEHGKVAEYPLRQGLAGYLWLCLYEKGYFTKADSIEELEGVRANTTPSRKLAQKPNNSDERKEVKPNE